MGKLQPIHTAIAVQCQEKKELLERHGAHALEELRQVLKDTEEAVSWFLSSASSATARLRQTRERDIARLGDVCSLLSFGFLGSCTLSFLTGQLLNNKRTMIADMLANKGEVRKSGKVAFRLLCLRLCAPFRLVIALPCLPLLLLLLPQANNRAMAQHSQRPVNK